MCTVGARLSEIAAAILILSFASRPALARGSPVGYDPVWSSERIARLPPEVRNAVTHICADPRAGDYFATYFDNSHLIKLHFEHLQCDREGSVLQGRQLSPTGIRFYGRTLSARKELLPPQ